MRKNHLRIGLFQPEIPQNTGNIARLVAATANRLCLIPPFGFATDDKQLRRAGLDYWPFLDLEIWDRLSDLLEEAPRFAFFSKKAQKPYTELPKDVDCLIFGRETQGLPDSLFAAYPEQFYSIPMFHPGVRSLNLANAVSIVTYYQMEQRGLL